MGRLIRGIYDQVPFKDPEYLLSLIVERAKTFYVEPVQLLTTSHSGRVDGVWVWQESEWDGELGWQPASMRPNAHYIRIPDKNWGLIGWGELVYRYCHHPEAKPQLIRQIYGRWPMMVEMKLPSY